jgi:hypothetical protein
MGLVPCDAWATPAADDATGRGNLSGRVETAAHSVPPEAEAEMCEMCHGDTARKTTLPALGGDSSGVSRPHNSLCPRPRWVRLTSQPCAATLADGAGAAFMKRFLFGVVALGLVAGSFSTIVFIRDFISDPSAYYAALAACRGKGWQTAWEAGSGWGQGVVLQLGPARQRHSRHRTSH